MHSLVVTLSKVPVTTLQHLQSAKVLEDQIEGIVAKELAEIIEMPILR